MVNWGDSKGRTKRKALPKILPIICKIVYISSVSLALEKLCVCVFLLFPPSFQGGFVCFFKLEFYVKQFQGGYEHSDCGAHFSWERVHKFDECIKRLRELQNV